MSTFQRLMEVCLSEENFETLVLYLDDILVFSRTIEEHIQRLDTVFTKLKAHGLKIKPSLILFLGILFIKCLNSSILVNILSHLLQLYLMT